MNGAGSCALFHTNLIIRKLYTHSCFRSFLACLCFANLDHSFKFLRYLVSRTHRRQIRLSQSTPANLSRATGNHLLTYSFMGQQHQRSIRRNLQQNVQQFSRSTNPPSPVYRYSRPFHCNRQQQAPNSDPRGRTQVETDMNRHTTAANTATAPEKLDISDVRDPSDISQLTAKQLKTILTRNCIDYKGVFEKEVLREKVMQLWIDCNEKRNLRNPLHDKDGSQLSDDIDEKSACKICMEREINCVLLECGHMLTCVPCGRKLAECPICRQNITRCVRTFKG